MITLFNGVGINGDSSIFPFGTPNGKARIKMWGSWGGATIQLFVSTPDQFSQVLLPCYDGFGDLVESKSNIVTPLYDYISNIPIKATITGATPATKLFCCIVPCC